MQGDSSQTFSFHELTIKSMRIDRQPESSAPQSNNQSAIIFQQPRKKSNNFLPEDLVRKSVTQRLINQEEEMTESDMGSEWANWDINQIKIKPPALVQENDQLYAVDRMRRKKSRSVDKHAKSPPKVVKPQTANNEQKWICEKERQRQRRRIMINRVLQGKGSFIWLFILGKNISETQIAPVKDIYKEYLDNDYVSPLCRSFEQIKKFFKMENFFFKVITDIEHADLIVQQSVNNPRIMAIHLYSNIRLSGTSDIFQLKRKSKKVKGVYHSLFEASNQVSVDLVEQARFIQINDSLQRASNFKLRLPAFFVLSGNDHSEVTSYRMSLYGAIKLQNKSQRASYLKQFTDMIEIRYAKEDKQLKNLQNYKSIDHISLINPEKAAEILKFYTKQTFYYAVTNSLLRLSRSSQEFSPCIIPFNQIYHSIKYFNDLDSSNRKSFRAYRGAKLRQSEVNSLAIGSYIQMLGFTSSSLDKSVAMKFMDDDSYLLEIIVTQNLEQQTSDFYQHGYVEINKHNLADTYFSKEQEILFNALNVYQVVQIDLRSAVRKIVLQYGALKYLKCKDNKKLTEKQRSILSNMQFCFDKLNSIQDDGDVLILAQEHDRAKEYYTRKLREGEDIPNIHAKLAFVQTELGNLQAAEQHALKLFNFMKTKQIESVNQKGNFWRNIESVASVLSLTQNTDYYQQLTDLQLNMTKNVFQKSKVLMSRAESKFKRGQYQGFLKDIIHANEVLDQQKDSFQKRRKSIGRTYFLKIACSCLDKEIRTTLQAERDAELLTIEQQQINFKANESLYYQMKIKIEEIKGNYLQKIRDKEKVNETFKKIKKYFKNLNERDEEINPIDAAKYYSLEAISVKNRDFSEYELLMETAIDIIKQTDPYHEQIGKLNLSLASERHIKLKKSLNYTDLTSDISSSKTSQKELVEGKKKYKQQFSYDDHKKTYKKCRYGYNEAINISLYHKGQDHPEYLNIQNKLSELNLEYSLLKEAEESAKQVSRTKIAQKHSEGARSYLLLAKIALSRGQLKRSFTMLQRADKILTIALCPRDNRTFLIKHPLYSEINLHKAKVFNRQTRHDLALRQLGLLERISQNLPASEELIANIMEEKAEIFFVQGNVSQFQKELLKSIRVRQKLMGKYNVSNAVNLQKLSMFTRQSGDSKAPFKYHQLALQIFTRFPVDHPNSWIVHLSNAFLFAQTKSQSAVLQQISKCMKIVERRYSPDNINSIKVLIQIGEFFKKLNLDQKALEIFELIDKNIERQLRKTVGRDAVSKDIDDEKIIIRKKVLKELMYLYHSVKGDQLVGIIGVEKCSNNLKDFQKIYLVEKVEQSLKSLA